MGKALQCPACRCAHPLDTLPATPTFRCHRCGQVLKVPNEILERAARRTGAVIPTAAAADLAGLARAGAEPHPFDDASYGAPLPPRQHVEGPRGSLVPERIPTVAPWWIRLIAWGIAIPAGGFLALRLSSLFGLFGLKQRRTGLVNMITTALEKGVGGMGSLMAFAAFWALTIAVLVTVILSLFVRWRSRRLGKRAAAPPAPEIGLGAAAVPARHAPASVGAPSTPSSASAGDVRATPQAATATPPAPVPAPAPAPHRDATDDWELPPRRT